MLDKTKLYNPDFTEIKYNIESHFDFEYYMSNQGYSGVDYVFIMLGANDGFTQHGINAIKIICENIHSYNSNIKIKLLCEYISPLIKIKYNNAVTRRKKQMDYFKMYKNNFLNYTYVELIPCNVVTDDFYDFPKTNISVSNRNTETNDVVTDLVHLNQYGYYKIADICYSYFLNSLI